MIKPIRSKQDYENALKRVEILMDTVPGSDRYDELEVLATLIDDYEAIHHAIDMPDPVEAIRFRMEQEGLQQKDLVSLLGSKARVSEILNKKRKLTLQMIRNLHDALNIPFENLLKEYQVGQ